MPFYNNTVQKKSVRPIWFVIDCWKENFAHCVCWHPYPFFENENYITKHVIFLKHLNHRRWFAITSEHSAENILSNEFNAPRVSTVSVRISNCLGLNTMQIFFSLRVKTNKLYVFVHLHHFARHRWIEHPKWKMTWWEMMMRWLLDDFVAIRCERTASQWMT